MLDTKQLIAPGAATGKVLTVQANDSILPETPGTGGITLGTPIATTSGTSIDFTGIPAGTKWIAIPLSRISTNGASNYLLQIGDAGGIEVSGYVGAAVKLVAATAIAGVNNSAGFVIQPSINATLFYSGVAVLVQANASTNRWNLFSTLSTESGGVGIYKAAGSKVLTAELDRIRLTTVGGSDTFDAGEMNIAYQ